MRKYNTIIFVPHAKARFRKITVSTRFLAICAGICVVVALSAVAFGWAYLSTASRDRQFRQALAENGRLKSTAAELARRLAGLSRQLSVFETRTQKLAIVAGLADVGRRGLGGPDLPSATDRTSELDSRLNAIESQLAHRSAVASSTPTVAPVRGLLNSGFGPRMDPFTGEASFHPGVDISTRLREPVLATAEGVVVKSGWTGDYGKEVEIAHSTGYDTIYGHLDVVLVADGQHVSRGQRIGLVGSTGRSTGPHLHYEIHKDNRAVNPLEYILDAR